MDLTTIDRVYMFDEALPSPSDYKTQINTIIAGVSALAETYLGRHVQNNTYIERFDIDKFSSSMINLKGYPILRDDEIEVGVPNPLSFVNKGTELALGDDIELNYSTGFVNPLIALEFGLEALEITYYGGMADDTTDFISKYPDLEYEVILQVIFEFKRRRNMAMESVGAGGNSAETYNTYELQPRFKQAFNKYRNTPYV